MKKKFFLILAFFSLITIFSFYHFSKNQKGAINFSQKSNTSTNVYSIYDNLDKYFHTSSPTQPTHIAATTEFHNVDELSKANLKSGDTVKTLGYYSANDGGGASYKIIEKKEKTSYYDLIPLKNNLYASLIPTDDTASVKQFGAKGDGKSDDSSYLNKAFNSGIKNITLPKAEYLVTKPIDISTSHLNIIGNSSTIFTDNNYRKGSTTRYVAVLNIFSASDISISKIKMYAKETKLVPYSVQFQIREASDICFSNCEFVIPESVLSEETSKVKQSATYCNGDVFTDWNNIVIENCTFTQLSDTNLGGIIGFRDIYNKGCQNAVFKNNTCTYNCHDEMIAVVSNTASIVENVHILNNTFNVLPGTDSTPRTMCFTIGYDDNYKLNNVFFEYNTIVGYANFSFLTFGNATNVSVAHNTIDFYSVTPSASPYFFYCTKPTLESNISIHDNTMTYSNSTSTSLNGICYGEVTFDKNIVTIDTEVPNALFNKNCRVSQNDITLNKKINFIGSSMGAFSQNNITLNSTFSSMFQFYNHTFHSDLTINDNIFTCNDLSGKSETILMLNGTKLNGNKLSFTDNKIYSPLTTQSKTLYQLSMGDTKAQTINISNNELNAFTKKYNWSNNSIKHNIILEGNTSN